MSDRLMYQKAGARRGVIFKGKETHLKTERKRRPMGGRKTGKGRLSEGGLTQLDRRGGGKIHLRHPIDLV